MAEQRPDVTQPTRLRAVSSDAGVAPQGDTQADASVAPVSPIGVAPLTVADRAGVALRAAVGVARELWLLPDRFLHVIIHGRAETMAEHRAYVKSRAWVPKGLSGGWEATITIAGLAHYLIVARPLKASTKAVKFAAEKVDQAADRAVSFYLAAAFVLVLFFLLARYL